MDKSHRGNASQFFVAGELCRRGHAAVVTLGNTPNTDVLCSNRDGTKFVHIQVKTFVPGYKTVSAGRKAEKAYGANFFWVLAGIPTPTMDESFVYFVIPSSEVARNVNQAHQAWLSTPGKRGAAHNDSDVRTIHLPPYKSFSGWDVSKYRNAWTLIEESLK